MAKKKFPYILIKDAKNGFRTQLVDGNGNPLMTSKALESASAVKKNLIAAYRTGMSYNFNINSTDKAILDSHKELLDLRYTGKSDAIYKMFKIEK